MIFINRRSNTNIPMRDPSKSSYSVPINANWNASLNNSFTASATQIVEKPTNMVWGKPTWYMLHTLAEKIKSEYFPQLRVEILNIIMRICNNLPCPDCTNHATAYMNRLNFYNIQTKEQLKMMLFQFHNNVNSKKKGYPMFPMNKLDSTYQRANTTNIITNFFHHFSKTNYSGRMGTENFHRTRTVRDIKEWIKVKAQYFDS